MGLYSIKALEDRAGFKGNSKRSPFTRPGAGWSRESIPFGETRQLLARELKALAATNVILEVDVLPGQIRLDGELYASAKVKSPAVRLHFDTVEHGHLNYQTDVFTTWQDNVRAIALGLEALRKVDRYEIGRGGEQYRGYLALEAGTGATALGGMTRDQALAVLDYPNGPEFYAAAWKRARAHAHPDRNGGDRTAWDQVEQAAKVLGLSA